MAESNTELTVAETNFQKNQLEEAEVICRKLLQESERNIRAMILMGRIMLRRYRVDEGIQYLEKAVESDPKYILAYKLLGEVYYNKGELDKAVNQFKKILEIDPLDIDAHKKVQELSTKVPVSNVPAPAARPVPEVPSVAPAEIKAPEEKAAPAIPAGSGAVTSTPVSPAVAIPSAPEITPSPAEIKPPERVAAPLVISEPAPAAATVTPASQAPTMSPVPPAPPVSPVGTGTKSPAEMIVPHQKTVSPQEAIELIKGRVVPLPPKAKTVIEKNLSEIKEIPGVIGSILINKDGLTTGSSLAQSAELDKELVGALSLSIYKATRNAIDTLNQGSLNQITLQTKDRVITIFNSDEFILTTIMQKNANLGLVRLENGRSIKRITEHFLTEKE